MRIILRPMWVILRNVDNALTAHIANSFGGDGSAVDLTIDGPVNWNSIPPTNPFFNNITIDAGQTLTVPAGTTIRCSGSFVNNGTLTVLTGATARGPNWSSGTPTSAGPRGSAHPGDAYSAATMGGFDNDSVADSVALKAGLGGTGIPEAVARLSFEQFRIGGGSGATAFSTVAGGGLVKIYCTGDIINNGAINANGTNGPVTGGGGGGLGLSILASTTLVDNTSGTINARGGNGGSDSVGYGSGGGGGGGIVIMMSSAAPIPATPDVSGGQGDIAASTQTNKGRIAGGGGGASGGDGGNGGAVSSGGVNASGGNGGIGYVITITGNPQFM